MTPRAVGASLVALLAIACVLIARPAAPQAGTSDELVRQVIQARMSTGFRHRATLTRFTAATNDRQVRQLLIKGRRDRQRASVLYQILWPEDRAGAIVIRDAGDHRFGGFVLQSGRTTTLNARLLDERFFDTDLRLEDLAEAFWYWPSRKIDSEVLFDEHRCTIVELVPAAGTATAYSLVRAWIAHDVGLPIRLEQFRAGRPDKVIDFRRVVWQGSRWLPTLITIEPSDGRTRTVIDGVKSEEDLDLPAAAFTLDAVKKSLGAPE